MASRSAATSLTSRRPRITVRRAAHTPARSFHQCVMCGAAVLAARLRPRPARPGHARRRRRKSPRLPPCSRSSIPPLQPSLPYAAVPSVPPPPPCLPPSPSPSPAPASPTCAWSGLRTESRQSSTEGIARNRIIVLRDPRLVDVGGFLSADAQVGAHCAQVIRRSRAKRWASGSPAAARHRGAPVSADTTVGPGSFHDVVGGG